MIGAAKGVPVTRLPKNSPVPDADEPGLGNRAADRLAEFEQARGLGDDDERASGHDRRDSDHVDESLWPPDDGSEAEGADAADGDAGVEPGSERADRSDEGEHGRD